MQKINKKRKNIGNVKNNIVGADASVRPNSKGITLLALVITVILMLMLAGVAIKIVQDGAIFDTAKEAKIQTEEIQEKQHILSAVKLSDSFTVEEIKSYLGEENAEVKKCGNNFLLITFKQSNRKYKVDKDGNAIDVTYGPATYKTSITGLATGVNLIPYKDLATEVSADIQAAIDEEKIQAVLRETTTVNGVATTYTAVVPTGFEISTTDGEDSIAGGLVIKDGSNEFVWVPVNNATSYTEDSFGPLEGTTTISGEVVKCDSYQAIQYYYGNALGQITTPESFEATFSYGTDQEKVVNNIQTYGGFYVGRYETTIDGNVIGVQRGKTVLTAATLLKPETEPKPASNENYYYRWWGLYKVQKDLYADDENVGSLMISSKQWGAMMTFTGYGNAARATTTYANENTPDLSGTAYATDTTKYDISKNIYDLAGNVSEYTLKAPRSYSREVRGGCCGSDSDYTYRNYASSSRNFDYPNYVNTYFRF